MAIKDFEMNIKNADGSYDILHPITKASTLINNIEDFSRISLSYGITAVAYNNLTKISNIVFLNLSVRKGAKNDIASGDIIGILPAEYRPSAQVSVPAVMFRIETQGALETSGMVAIRENGEIVATNYYAKAFRDVRAVAFWEV